MASKGSHEDHAGERFATYVKRAIGFLLLESAGRVTLVVGVLVAAVVGGTLWAWRDYRAQVLAGPDYQLTAERIQLVPPLESAPWIHRDLRTEALRNAGLERAQLVADDTLAKRLADAFALHPWVDKVQRVRTSYPAAAVVELSYRRPVAIVKVEGQGNWPIDAQGCLLPSEDFSPVEIPRYLTVLGVMAPPAGPTGSRWGDARVHNAAAIAAALIDDWPKLNLAAIHALPPASAIEGAEQTTYQLWTAAGTRVQWGRASDLPSSDEPTTSEKIALLRDYLAQHGSLDRPGGHELDLRRRGQVIQVPNAASRDTPGQPPRR